MSKRERYWKNKLAEIRRRKRSQASTFEGKAIRSLIARTTAWQKKTLTSWLRASPERLRDYESSSGIPLKRFYTPSDLSHLEYLRDLGFPGEFPLTRGVYPNMYRGKLWTMRMFSGFGTPEDTNKRLKYLLDQGETGLSIAFDMPTLYGYDCDHPRAQGEVGRCGVNVSSLKDMETIFDGIPLDKVSTSMTINAPAAVLTCMYMAVGDKQSVKMRNLRGTVQTDILKEYIAQKEWAYPPEAHLRIIRDLMVYSAKHMPNWNYISISGYHIREAGANAVQELAFTLADGFAYVELGIGAGLKVDQFAPRLSFFFNCTMDFFEEIAKFRAARRIWATVMKEKYHARDPRSLWLRFHAQTSGASLTWQQPMNNIVRTTIEALAAVLGGTQSLHTNSFDEAWALPTEKAVMVALRTQQIIAEETGVADVTDPLGGSYFLERLTDEIEERAYRYIDKIDSLGGVLEAIRAGYLQREIAENAYRDQQKLEKGEHVMVGANKHIIDEEPPIETLKVNLQVQARQTERLQRLKRERNNLKVQATLKTLKSAFKNPRVNSIYPLLSAVRAYSTLGEIMDVGREVFGEWREPNLL